MRDVTRIILNKSHAAFEFPVDFKNHLRDASRLQLEKSDVDLATDPVIVQMFYFWLPNHTYCGSLRLVELPSSWHSCYFIQTNNNWQTAHFDAAALVRKFLPRTITQRNAQHMAFIVTTFLEDALTAIYEQKDLDPH